MATAIGTRRSNGTFISSGALIRYAGFPDPLLKHHFGNILNEHLTRNATLGQRTSTANLHDPRRDINKECGYPETELLTVEHFQDLFDRHAVAQRVVEAWPDECWQIYPEVFEDEDPDVKTDFEQALQDINKTLRGQSYHLPEQDTMGLWSLCRTADILSGIGFFGIILLGVDDSKDLSEEVAGVNDDGTYSPQQRETKLTYLRTFSESVIDIATVETDEKSPRFGMPKTYKIKFDDTNDNFGQPALTSANKSLEVHWSRIIHIVDNATNSIVFGVPRLRPIYNNIMDLSKVYSGSGEMYWRGALPGWSFETHPQLGGDVNVDVSSMRDEVEDLMNGLQRYLFSSGISAKSLAPQVSDPTAQIKIQLEAICIQTGIPMRKLLGSERGELSSSDDDRSLKRKTKARHMNYCNPQIVIPLMDRLIGIGVLPEPTEGYTIRWPDGSELSAEQEDDRLVKRTAAAAQFVTSGMDTVVPPKHYFTRWVGLEDREVDEMLSEAIDRLDDTDGVDDPLMKEKSQTEQKEQERFDAEAKIRASGSVGGGGAPAFGKKS